MMQLLLKVSHLDRWCKWLKVEKYGVYNNDEIVAVFGFLVFPCNEIQKKISALQFLSRKIWWARHATF